VEELGEHGVWDSSDTLPEMCHRNRKEYLCSTCPLAAFFDSELLEYDASYAMSLFSMQKAFKMFIGSMKGSMPSARTGRTAGVHSSSSLRIDRSVCMSFIAAEGCEWHDVIPEEHVGKVDPLTVGSNKGNKGIISGVRLKQHVAHGVVEEVDTEDDDEDSELPSAKRRKSVVARKDQTMDTS
jgi:hypothetical protein